MHTTSLLVLDLQVLGSMVAGAALDKLMALASSRLFVGASVGLLASTGSGLLDDWSIVERKLEIRDRGRMETTALQVYMPPLRS